MSEVGAFTPVLDPRPLDVPWPSVQWPIPDDTVLRGSTVFLSRIVPGDDAAPLYAALDDDAVWAAAPGRPDSVEQLRHTLTDRCARPNWFPWTVRLC